MAELVDALDSGSSERKFVEVRLLSRALLFWGGAVVFAAFTIPMEADRMAFWNVENGRVFLLSLCSLRGVALW